MQSIVYDSGLVAIIKPTCNDVWDIYKKRYTVPPDREFTFSYFQKHIN